MLQPLCEVRHEEVEAGVIQDPVKQGRQDDGDEVEIVLARGSEFVGNDHFAREAQHLGQ